MSESTFVPWTVDAAGIVVFAAGLAFVAFAAGLDASMRETPPRFAELWVNAKPAAARAATPTNVNFIPRFIVCFSSSGPRRHLHRELGTRDQGSGSTSKNGQGAREFSA